MGRALRGTPVPRTAGNRREMHSTQASTLVLFGGIIKIRPRAKKKKEKKVQLEIRELAPLPIFRMLSWHPDFLKQKLIQRHRGKYSAVHIAFLNINNASSLFGKKFGNLSYM